MNQRVLKQQIERIIEQIKPYGPEKIILFGSLARRKFKQGSDLDLLIIKKTKQPPHQRISEVLNLLYPKEWYLSSEESLPVDILVYTPNEIQKELNLGDFFIEEVLNKGKVLYEKA